MSFIWGGGRGGSRSQGGSRTGEFMTAHEQNKLMHKSRHTLLHPFLICTFFYLLILFPPSNLLRWLTRVASLSTVYQHFPQWDCKILRFRKTSNPKYPPTNKTQVPRQTFAETAWRRSEGEASLGGLEGRGGADWKQVKHMRVVRAAGGEGRNTHTSTGSSCLQLRFAFNCYICRHNTLASKYIGMMYYLSVYNTHISVSLTLLGLSRCLCQGEKA